MKDKGLKCGVVIGTKDREVALATCLSSLVTQIVRPSEVVIVDDGNMTDAWISTLFKNNGIGYKYIRKEKYPGLVFSRNLGADKVKSDVVLFLDDDVILEPDYIKEILKIYEKDTAGDVGGVGGVLVGKKMNIFKRLFLRFFCLDDFRRDGEMLASGIGVLVRNIDAEKEIQWLSGCNMSFRKTVFDDFRFDESFGGNGWGDDRDFSYRVSRKYRLIAAPRARLIHVEDPSGRVDTGRFGYMETYHTYLFFKKNMEKTFSGWCVLWWAMFGICLKNLFKLDINGVRGNIKGIYSIFSEINR